MLISVRRAIGNRNALMLTVLLAFASSRALADVYVVEFYDRNNTNPSSPNYLTGGPVWTGRVDTDTNTLTFESWNEYPGTPVFWSGAWTPNVGANIVWNAYKEVTPTPSNPQGKSLTQIPSNAFVPNVPGGTEGTFRIDSTWGFVSPIPASAMSWVRWEEVNGAWTKVPAVYPDYFTFLSPASREFVDFYPGWGAAVLRTNGGPLLLETNFTQATMPLLPEDRVITAQVDAPIIKARLVASSVGGGGNIAAVPEASAGLFGLGAALAGIIARIKTRRG